PLAQSGLEFAKELRMPFNGMPVSSEARKGFVDPDLTEIDKCPLLGRKSKAQRQDHERPPWIWTFSESLPALVFAGECQLSRERILPSLPNF
ncbi:hypothetical protein STEG23_026799, partial [Scotinomys teguina]